VKINIVVFALIMIGCGGAVEPEETGTTSTETGVELSELHLLVEESSEALVDEEFTKSELPVYEELSSGLVYEIFVDSDDPDKICSEVQFPDGDRAGPCIKGGNGSLMEGVGDYRVTLTIY